MQEVFNTVVRHLGKQKSRSVHPEFMAGSNHCAYRGHAGKKCAVGVLIPDEQYRASFECKSVKNIAHHIPALAGMDVMLLSALQTVHDRTEPFEWETALREMARKRKLTFPEDAFA